MQEYIEFIGENPFLFLALLATLGLILFTEFQRLGRKFKEITPTQATLLQNNEDAILLDIREAKDFQAGHITGAKHMPADQLSDKISTLASYKQSPLIVYCQMGNRSHRACNLLIKEGFAKVYSIAGGVMGWQKADLPLVKG